MTTQYTVKSDLKPSSLNGISDDQINDHWKLYEAYVAQSNALREQLSTMRSAGEGATPAYMDRRRRFGFELNGVILHELYFGNLKAGTDSQSASKFKSLVEKTFGSFEAWQEDFANTGKSRGIGWAICALDENTGEVNNHFIQLHEDGNVAGYTPLVVMDVWEHAYMVDHKAGGRPDYIGSFMSNINWEMVETRLG